MQWIASLEFQLLHLSWNALSLFGALLICGLIGGQAVAKISWLPRISGYLLAGFALGEEGLNWVAGDVFEIMRAFADVAIALIVYQLGRYVDVRWLVRERWLVLTVLLASALSFLLAWGALEWQGVARETAMLCGIFAIATSPSIVIAVMRDAKAEGHITRRLAAMTALNNVIALLAAYSVLPLLALEEKVPVTALALHAGYSIAGALLLAGFAYCLTLLLARWLGRRRQQQFVLVIAVIALTLGGARLLQLPVLLTMLMFAILSRNLDYRYDLMDLEFGLVSELFIVLLFVTLGATMHIPALPAVAIPAGLLMLTRYIAVGGGALAFARPARLSWSQAALLGVGNLPLTESGLALVQIAAVYPHTTADLLPLLTGALMVSDILGPVATQFALRRSGECGRT